VGEFFLVLGVLLLAAFIFVVWLIARVVMWIVGGLFGIARQSQPQPTAGVDAPRGWMNCRRAGCREANPLHARFCRRCGNQLAGVGDVTRLRYVA
jgi:hypothetical protein